MPKKSEIQGIVKLILSSPEGVGTTIGIYYEHSFTKENTPELNIRELENAYDICPRFTKSKPLALFCTYLTIKETIKKEKAIYTLKEEYQKDIRHSRKTIRKQSLPVV
tara:strand:+ start:152 stop:475 length:324 start_codon:yes stop_codon:yes gene_type:complete